MKPKKQIRKGVITAKLTFFDWGWEDNIIYRQKARVNEKEKGIQMISQIKKFFGVTDKDIKENEEISIKHEIQKIKLKRDPWTRDAKGNIISPFDKKIKERDAERRKNG